MITQDDADRAGFDDARLCTPFLTYTLSELRRAGDDALRAYKGGWKRYTTKDANKPRGRAGRRRKA